MPGAQPRAALSHARARYFSACDKESGHETRMAALRGQLRTLANDRNLRRFVVKATPTGRRLGTGSYGTVEEVY